MNLVDTCGWIEYFEDGPNADFFADAIETPRTLVVPTICMAEAFRYALRQADRAFALEVVAAMQTGQVADLTASVALEAGRVGVELGLPLADSLIVATARLTRSTVLTQDAHFKDVPGVRYVEKPRR